MLQLLQSIHYYDLWMSPYCCWIFTFTNLSKFVTNVQKVVNRCKLGLNCLTRTWGEGAFDNIIGIIEETVWLLG